MNKQYKLVTAHMVDELISDDALRILCVKSSAPFTSGVKRPLANIAPHHLDRKEQVEWYFRFLRGTIDAVENYDVDVIKELDYIVCQLRRRDVMLIGLTRDGSDLPHKGKPCHTQVIQELINEHRGSSLTKPTFDSEYEGVSLKFLSNTFLTPIRYRGIPYPSVAHALASTNVTDAHAKVTISQLVGVKAIEDYLANFHPNELNTLTQQEEFDIMWEVLNIKFASPVMKEKLQTLPVSYIPVHFNKIHDNVWGACTCSKCKGKRHLNMLGKMIEAIRG